MQAVVINRTGGLEVLKLVKDYPVPARKTGQVSASDTDSSSKSFALLVAISTVLVRSRQVTPTVRPGCAITPLNAFVTHTSCTFLAAVLQRAITLRLQCPDRVHVTR
jgi:hypothetical protein